MPAAGAAASVPCRQPSSGERTHTRVPLVIPFHWSGSAIFAAAARSKPYLPLVWFSVTGKRVPTEVLFAQAACAKRQGYSGCRPPAL